MTAAPPVTSSDVATTSTGSATTNKVGNCCTEHATPGCNVSDTEASVCASDSWCCDSLGEWDSPCVDKVEYWGCASCP